MMIQSWNLRVQLLIFTILLNIVTCRVTVPQKTIQELISKAFVESIATRQRNLLDESLESQEYMDMGDDQDPEEMPGFFEGDMAGVYDELGRVGINFEKFPQRKWKNNTVHYIISPHYLPDEYMIVKTAVRILDFFTCVNFREWDGKEPDYLVFWPVERPAGCWSYVGRLGGPQIVSLQPPDLKSPQCFAGIGRPLHETMHALGVYHEQSRPDRDKFVTVMKKNVLKGTVCLSELNDTPGKSHRIANCLLPTCLCLYRFINNFDKLDVKNATFPFEYDYDSIMHYGTTFFSRNKKNATLVPKQKNKKIGQRINLSKLDCMKLNSLYGCLDGSAFNKRKYTTICDFLGL